jgi:hypothetical protein
MAALLFATQKPVILFTLWHPNSALKALTIAVDG